MGHLLKFKVTKKFKEFRNFRQLSCFVLCKLFLLLVMELQFNND